MHDRRVGRHRDRRSRAAAAPTRWSATPTSRSTPPRPPGAASTASTSRRCTREASDRQVLENDLRQALDRGELSVAYQPIVRAAGEEVCGFEALVRWDHPARGPISPDKFIPLAEECGMIGKIGTFVLDTALERSQPLARPCPDRGQSVADPVQRSGDRRDRRGGAARDHKLRAERLELEITEGVFLADSDATDETFANLKALGVRLALDDFGTGYSSLGYLKKAPFDKIKIDQSFVRGAASTDQPQRAIIRAIVTPRRQPRHGHHRRGRRDPRRSAADPRARRQPDPGLYLRPPGDRRSGARAGQRSRPSRPTASSACASRASA